MDYLTLKWIHIVSSTFLFGTGVGSAFYKFLADRSGNVQNIAQTNRHVVWADWIFTTPSFVIQPLSGLMLLHVLGMPLTTPWVITSIALYVVTGICWLPVVFLQIRMRDVSAAADANSRALPIHYWHLAQRWFWLGWIAFVAMVAIFYLMVHKPSLWL